MRLESWLAIGVTVCFLLACINIYWLLVSGRIDIIRQAYARFVCKRDHRIESYIEGLRKLAEE